MLLPLVAFNDADDVYTVMVSVKSMTQMAFLAINAAQQPNLATTPVAGHPTPECDCPQRFYCQTKSAPWCGPARLGRRRESGTALC
jgi:hypothetical protein